MLKRICFLLVLVVTLPALAASGVGGSIGGLRQHNHSSTGQGGANLAPADIAMTGDLTSTKACAAGYTRKTPNFCLKTGERPRTSLVRDSCTAVAAPSADATAVYLGIAAFAQAANAVALRYALVEIHDSATCALVNNQGISAESREFNATAAGTEINGVIAPMIAPVMGTGSFYLRFKDDGGNQGAADYVIRGYFD